MAGPSSIQKVPAGLLSMLDMKGVGANPVDLSMAVAPVIDVTEFYSNQLVISAASGSVNAAGNTVELVVPAGERWRVLNITLAVGAGTDGDTMGATCTLRTNTPTGGTQSVEVLPQFSRTVNVGLTEYQSANLPFPWLLDAGVIIRCECITITAAGNMTLSPRVLYQRLVV